MASRTSPPQPCMRRRGLYVVEDVAGVPTRVAVWLKPCNHLYRFQRARKHTGASRSREYLPCADCEGEARSRGVLPADLPTIRALREAVQDDHRLRALVLFIEDVRTWLSRPPQYALIHELRDAAERHGRQAGLFGGTIEPSDV